MTSALWTRGQRVAESAAVAEHHRLWFAEGEDAQMQEAAREMCGERALGRGAQAVFSAPAPAPAPALRASSRSSCPDHRTTESA
jgi:hypothetical protein